MKLYITKSDTITVSKHPFIENNTSSIEFESNEEDYNNFVDGVLDFDIVDDKVITKSSIRKQELLDSIKKAEEEIKTKKQEEIVKKLELISKISNGTATLEEQEEFANLI